MVWNLETVPWPFEDNSFDECHGYQTIEHCTGQQGDAEAFFRFFTEAWRILKPAGLFIASVPRWDSIWALGDPSHKRVISHATISFLSQREYESQVGRTQMADYRYLWHGDFELAHSETVGDSYNFVLRALK